MRTKKCPYCKGEIKIFYDNERGDEVYCDQCEQEFELRSVEPIILEPLSSFNYEERDYA